MSSSEDVLVINAFEGAISVAAYQPPLRDRAFYFDVTFHLDHPRLVKLASGVKPPLHFHPYQREFIRVIEGRLAVEIEGREHVLTPENGELTVLPWTSHRLYPLIPVSDGGELQVTRFLLSGEETADAFKLDLVFFQNWYGYQDAVMVEGKSMDLIQVMNIFDAGGTYLSFPTWLPFSNRLAQWAGILLGRWVGGALGYQPFYKKWTSDWSTACRKMETSPFLRKFADRSKQD